MGTFLVVGALLAPFSGAEVLFHETAAQQAFVFDRLGISVEDAEGSPEFTAAGEVLGVDREDWDQAKS